MGAADAGIGTIEVVGVVDGPKAVTTSLNTRYKREIYSTTLVIYITYYQLHYL